MSAGDFFGEIAALTGSPRTADVVADVDTTLLEVPADALRATMVVPEIQSSCCLDADRRGCMRTESADLPRLAGVDQEDLRDLRTPRPGGRGRCQRTYAASPASVSLADSAAVAAAASAPDAGRYGTHISDVNADDDAEGADR